MNPITTVEYGNSVTTNHSQHIYYSWFFIIPYVYIVRGQSNFIDCILNTVFPIFLSELHMKIVYDKSKAIYMYLY